MFINGKISLEDFLPNLQSNTNISDATLIKRKGKRIYGAKRRGYGTTYLAFMSDYRMSY